MKNKVAVNQRVSVDKLQQQLAAANEEVLRLRKEVTLLKGSSGVRAATSFATATAGTGINSDQAVDGHDGDTLANHAMHHSMLSSQGSAAAAVDSCSHHWLPFQLQECVVSHFGPRATWWLPVGCHVLSGISLLAYMGWEDWYFN